MKKYGIYLFYPPTIDLTSEGLGRYFAYFLSASLARKDIQFVIACPSWMPETLTKMFLDYGIKSEEVELIYPPKKPIALKIYAAIGAVLKIKNRCFSIVKNWIRAKNPDVAQTKQNAIKKVIFFSNKSSGRFFLTVLFLVIFSPVILIFLFGLYLGRIFLLLTKEIALKVKAVFAKTRMNHVVNKIGFVFRANNFKPVKNILFFQETLAALQKVESKLLLTMINKRKDISAWYSPTAFWPEFNKINAPKLCCVPDVVLHQFPIDYALAEDRRKALKGVQRTIQKGQYFVTYSQDVKENTLLRRYSINPNKVFVIPHGANQLDRLIGRGNFSDNQEETQTFCYIHFSEALLSCQAKLGDEIQVKHHPSMKYIFYASQARPHKNILSLLKAYAHLLRRRYMAHKLILTGNPFSIPEIFKFIIENRLQDDVLWLHGVSSQQLAVLYKLADLAVNPSLSEGGCPFTFTEALSVDTPVIMARINVSEEILTDPELQQATFFDPYDYKDMANKIEWALQNKEDLLAIQKPFYTELVKRSWGDVVDDYVKVLDKISEQDGQVST
jgi:glycosyltransferase involved in cell wall biosynthesis